MLCVGSMVNYQQSRLYCTSDDTCHYKRGRLVGFAQLKGRLYGIKKQSAALHGASFQVSSAEYLIQLKCYWVSPPKVPAMLK